VEALKEAAALIIGYLLGSFPTAYLLTCALRKQDIRRIGGGNIGALNTIREVGKVPGAFVIIVDMSKGAAAVCIACFALQVPFLFVLLAGFAAVVGHLWMIFLKFSGGRGMGAAIGSVIAALCIYSQWLIAGIFIGIIAVPLLTTRNVPLSMALGFFALPFLTGFIAHNGTATIIAAILALLLAGKFAPTAVRGWQRAGSLYNYIFHDQNPPKPPYNEKS
jgi:acyl phosphate:glycerol-3-phosphate acyltransferase